MLAPTLLNTGPVAAPNSLVPLNTSRSFLNESKSQANKPQGLRTVTFGTGMDLITYIFPDFKAVEYFRKEFVSLNEFHILEKTESSGFEIYLVDQWIRDRKIGSVASVFTGNAQSKVKVCKFTTVKKQSRHYPPRFQEYLNELLLNHATFKKMDQVTTADSSNHLSADDSSGIPAYLLVSNISAMPHNLFLVPIPGGDAMAFEQRFMVNSNLRKLNCGGRSLSLSAEKVSDASEDKFRQMYHILNESVPIHFAILELVNLVQTCLFYYDLLDAKYADGLLCHKTEEAIKTWWNLIGLPHFNFKPNHKSGILSSKTVAAILSLTVSVKLRLQLIGGCDVPKDIFDAESFMISIGHFQKQVKIEKRRKLNLVTLSRLFYYTNQGHLAEKAKSFYSPFSTELSVNDSDASFLFDQSYTSPSSAGRRGISSNTSLPGQAASAYRRNKIYYSKELKKLTNVVKNTVQDHIMVKEDQDDLYPDLAATKPTAKLRSKIVSKLSETLEPTDIETMSIEIFAKKCIVGKTLLRLWIGLSSADAKLAHEVSDGDKLSLSSSSDTPKDVSKNSTSRDHFPPPLQNIRHHRHHYHHQSQRRTNREGPEGVDGVAGLASSEARYHFLSFRDSFTINQDLNQVADKSGRLGRMKLTLQGRKGLAKAELIDPRDTSDVANITNDEEVYGSLLDAELLKMTESRVTHNDFSGSDNGSFVSETKHRNSRTLKRRNSYPIAVCDTGMDSSRTTTFPIEATPDTEYGLLKRATSYSALEGCFSSSSDLITYERIRKDYWAQVSRILATEGLRKELERKYYNEIINKGELVGIETYKIQHMHSSMLQRKLRFDAEYKDALDFRMRDLTDNLDRMAFRSRDLIKKIDELDEHLNAFDSKLRSESMSKLDEMIDKVLRSSKFNSVFSDRDERLQIIKSLTGSELLDGDWHSGKEANLGLRAFIVFFYQLLLIVLRVFHFDRSKMNLDRIRGQYKKLDPNREYISKLYHLLGRELKTEPAEKAPATDPNRH